MSISFTLGNNVVTLSREGGVITFHRDYDGKPENRITHVFDDRADDPFKVHKTDARTVATGVYWGCLGRMPSAWVLEQMIQTVSPVLSK